ncbi:hypothetical protein CC80DRAFT_221951 [Byssothecium circinans]|uniref:Glycosyltransferase family 25 protein n=1 Tax=Byssothecium circinans TaxID=147558 RepID=A0A6A5TH37_9PLEO|nr:hypothetical protein CC80DRAFT_221951 [Byssothecium circinans]
MSCSPSFCLSSHGLLCNIMLLRSHGRFYLAVTLCLLVALLILSQYVDRFESPFRFIASSNPRLVTLDGIANQTLGFEKVFVINAPWRTDRRDAMTLAASFHDISFDWIEGVNPQEIRDTAYPPGNHREVTQGARGCWRAHLNALREYAPLEPVSRSMLIMTRVVAQNLSTALILEDDVDWDFRIRSQLSYFARAARKLPALISQANLHSQERPPASEEKTLGPVELAKRSSVSLSSTPFRNALDGYPYGCEWDVLYIGHCGADFPPSSIAHPTRIFQLNDATVPVPGHLRFRSSAPQDAFASLYPPHTRLYHRTSNSTLCLHAYAVTQRGARKILYQFGIRDFSQGFDFALSDYCGGNLQGSQRLMCLTVQPPLLSQYWSTSSGGSDITGTGSSGRMVGSRYVRWSVRASLEGPGLSAAREMGSMADQWPDE